MFLVFAAIVLPSISESGVVDLPPLVELPPPLVELPPFVEAPALVEVPVSAHVPNENATNTKSFIPGQLKGADIPLTGSRFGCGYTRDCLSCQKLEREGCYWSEENGCFQLPRGVKKVSYCSGLVEVGEIKAKCRNYPTCELCTMQSGCVFYRGECRYSSGPSCRQDIFNCANAPEDCPEEVYYMPLPHVPSPFVEGLLDDPYVNYPNYPFLPFQVPRGRHSTRSYTPYIISETPYNVRQTPFHTREIRDTPYNVRETPFRPRQIRETPFHPREVRETPYHMRESQYHY